MTKLFNESKLDLQKMLPGEWLVGSIYYSMKLVTHKLSDLIFSVKAPLFVCDANRDVSPLAEPDQNKERMMAILEDRSLSFLFPLLHLQTELWLRIQTEPSATDLYKWVRDKVDLKLQKTPGFIVILVTRCAKIFTPGLLPSE